MKIRGDIKRRINKIVKNFNFGYVHKCMTLLDMGVYDPDSKEWRVPTVDEMREDCREHLEELFINASRDGSDMRSSHFGRFRANCYTFHVKNIAIYNFELLYVLAYEESEDIRSEGDMPQWGDEERLCFNEIDD